MGDKFRGGEQHRRGQQGGDHHLEPAGLAANQSAKGESGRHDGHRPDRDQGREPRLGRAQVVAGPQCPQAARGEVGDVASHGEADGRQGIYRQSVALCINLPLIRGYR